MNSKYGLRAAYTPRHTPKKQKLGLYLRGPVPWEWIKKAQALHGSALPVGLVLWHYRSLRKSMTFKIGHGDICQLLGISTSSSRRAMRALCNAGLVQMAHKSGSKSTVTIVEAIP